MSVRARVRIGVRVRIRVRVRVRVGVGVRAARTQVARRNYPPGARHVHIVVLRLAVTHLARGGFRHDVGDGLRPASTWIGLGLV